MGWRASAPSPPAGSRPSDGAQPLRRRLHAGLPGCLLLLLGTCAAQNGYLFKERSKPGCSSRNRAPPPGSGGWAASLALAGSPAPGSQAPWSPGLGPGSLQCQGGIVGAIVRVLLRGGETSPPAQRSLQEPEGAGVSGSFRGNPGGLASCPDRLQTWAAGCWAREDGRQCRRELGGAVPFRPCTPSPKSQEPLPPWAGGGSGTLP